MEDLEYIVTKQGAEAAIKHIGEALGKVIGLPAEEFGELLRDHIRYRRARNFVKFYEKYQQLVSASNVKQQEVPLRVWFPIVEKASLEDDENLREKWAALLLNAANPKANVTSAGGFIEVLGQLSPSEVELLDMVYAQDDDTQPYPPEKHVSLDSLESRTSLTKDQVQTALQNMRRLNLVAPILQAKGVGRTLEEFNMGMPEPGLAVTEYGWGQDYRTTPYGRTFVAACRGSWETASQKQR